MTGYAVNDAGAKLVAAIIVATPQVRSELTLTDAALTTNVGNVDGSVN